jgi:hypothetical protein
MPIASGKVRKHRLTMVSFVKSEGRIEITEILPPDLEVVHTLSRPRTLGRFRSVRTLIIELKKKENAMASSISSSSASTAMLSRPIAPQPAAVPQAQTDSSKTQSANAVASELLALSTEGPLGRNVNQMA